ncbi:MAG TPA: hypothetical protein VN864_08750 [Thermoplasmata archaeon]|nr:hypothetical protein [Thermoplasmata archaeon]
MSDESGTGFHVVTEASTAHSSSRWARALALAGTAVLLALVTFSYIPGTATTLSHNGAPASPASGTHSVASHVAAMAAPADTTPFGALQLGITDSPGSICAYQESSCAAGVGMSRVTLSANAAGSGFLAWPNVQVAFVIETTAYDGVYDPLAGDPGSDPCASATTGPCEESNGVPFFVAHSQDIANAISEANPHSHVSFAMVDYFATKDNFDDGDGSEYHVDIQDFVPSSDFGSSVISTFQAEVLGGGYIYGDSDFSDNILHSSVITAMYGTIIGSGLTWSLATHHVIVWMGSTAPRDPNYIENYCVSASDYANFGSCNSPGCEPAYTFLDGSSPNCEGWIRSQDGNRNDSIARLTKTAPTCTDSIGGVCTVDMIDLWTTSTDPLSKGWPTGRANGGPGGSAVVQNVQHVLLAGCDMADATGGTWNGPAFFTCPDGQTGSLQYVPHGPPSKPNLNNPTLLQAFREVGFGPVLETQVAAGSNRPIFQYVPFGNIAFANASTLDPTQQCQRHGLNLKNCGLPLVYTEGGVKFLGWNWSSNASQNQMFIGDTWTASFNVVAVGGPFRTVPIDACTTAQCHAGGSTALNGIFTSATYVPYTNNSVITESFPLALLNVELTPGLGPAGVAPPPPPPVPPPFAIAAPAPLPVIQQIGIGNQVGVANISLQAAAAGFLGAGFVRVQLKNKPVAMRVAAKSGPMGSKFDAASAKKSGGVGHFE